MINFKIRQDAFKKVKGNLQFALLVAFCSEILNIVLKLYISSFVTEDFIYSIQDGIIPTIAPEYIRIVGFMLLAIIFINPILRLGANRFFLNLYRGKEAKFTDILAFVKRPFRAWFAYAFLILLYAMWCIVPIGIYYMLIRTASLQVVMMFSWLLYIPIFYAGIRYFAYTYIISEDHSIGFIKAAKKSAAILKGNGLLLLAMLAYFMILNMVFSMVENILLGLGIFGTTISLFVELGIKTWMLASLAGLFCFLNAEKVGIVVEKIKIENDEDLRKFLNNKFRMLENHEDMDRIEVPFFKSEKRKKSDDSDEDNQSDENSQDDSEEQDKE